MDFLPAIIDIATGGALSEIQDKNNEERARDAFERQVYLRSTAHQAEVEDLRKAGLNPILSANKGGASAPSVAMAAGGAAPGGTFSASQASNAQARLSDEQGRSQQMQQHLMAAQARQASSAAAVNDSQVHVQEATRLKILSEVPQIQADTKLKSALERLSGAQFGLTGAQQAHSEASANESIQRTANLALDAQSIEERLKALRTEGKIDESMFGEVMRIINRGVQSIRGSVPVPGR